MSLTLKVRSIFHGGARGVPRTPHEGTTLVVWRRRNAHLTAAVWDPPFRPHEDHAAAAVHALVLRGGAEDVGVDLDRENLRRDQRQGRSLDRRQREVHAVDEVRRRAVVGERGIEDLALPPLQLDQIARSIGPQPYPWDHPEHLFELDRAGALDISRVEEVPLRRLAAPLE